MPRASTDPAPTEIPEESLEELYEHALAGYATTRPDGTLVRVNATLAGWQNRRAGELVGRRVSRLLTIGGRILFETHLRPLLQMQGAFDEVALELTREGGAPVPVLVNARLHRDAGGLPHFIRFTFFNATERRRYELELLQARRRAENASRAKSVYLAALSHDVRTPLSAAASAVELLARLSPTPVQERYLRVLRNANESILSLVNEMLELSRLEAGRVSLVTSRTDLKELVDATVGSLAARAEVKSIELIVEIDPALPAFVLIDALKLSRVLANLVGNAIKFTNRGSVRLSLTRVEAADGVRLEVRVIDTGIGIAPERLPIMFEEYTQESPEVAMTHGGTGLGLAISRRLVGLLGGTLEAESAPGHGSSFHFSLPLVPAAPPGDEPAPEGALLAAADGHHGPSAL